MRPGQRPSDLDGLTRAEREVFEHAVTGAKTSEIASRLFVTEATVRTHLTRIYAKLGVDGKPSLIARYADPAPAPAVETRPATPLWVLMSIVALIAVAVVLSVQIYTLGHQPETPAIESVAPHGGILRGPAATVAPPTVAGGVESRGEGDRATAGAEDVRPWLVAGTPLAILGLLVAARSRSRGATRAWPGRMSALIHRFL